MTASTLILYVFYRIPLTYVAASPGGGNRYIRAVDLGIIALLGCCTTCMRGRWRR